jgi:hypothetical protein
MGSAVTVIRSRRIGRTEKLLVALLWRSFSYERAAYWRMVVFACRSHRTSSIALLFDDVPANVARHDYGLELGFRLLAFFSPDRYRDIMNIYRERKCFLYRCPGTCGYDQEGCQDAMCFFIRPLSAVPVVTRVYAMIIDGCEDWATGMATLVSYRGLMAVPGLGRV